MLFLFSGLLGAIIATLLNVLYHYVSEQRKIKSDILLDIVSYIDEIYRHLIDMHVQKNAIYSNKKPLLNQDEYAIMSRSLTALLISSKPAAKLALVYGEGNIMQAFNELKKYFHEISSELRKSTKNDWVEKNGIISRLFANEIDPLRAKLEELLLIESHHIEILKGIFRNLFRWLPGCTWKKE
jgi:hypothetical protein